eukprot:scaffold130200_cov36-Tisochrysis_lutea.AAC.3
MPGADARAHELEAHSTANQHCVARRGNAPCRGRACNPYGARPHSSPMQFRVNGQWWSKSRTQLSQSEQWLARGGR